jgi:hypothetical protein
MVYLHEIALPEYNSATSSTITWMSQQRSSLMLLCLFHRRCCHGVPA